MKRGCSHRLRQLTRALAPSTTITPSPSSRHAAATCVFPQQSSRTGFGTYRQNFQVLIDSAPNLEIGLQVSVAAQSVDVTEQQTLENQLRAELSARAHAMHTMSELLGSAGAPADARQVNAVEALSRQVGDLVVRLRRQADQLRAIFNLSPDGFISFDAERRVQYVSPACALLTAIGDRHVLGQDEAGLEALLHGRIEHADSQRPLRLQELREQPRTVRATMSITS